MEEPRRGVIRTNTQVGGTHRRDLDGIAPKRVRGDVIIGRVRRRWGIHFWVVECDVVQFVDVLEFVAVQVVGGEESSASEIQKGKEGGRRERYAQRMFPRIPIKHPQLHNLIALQHKAIRPIHPHIPHILCHAHLRQQAWDNRRVVSDVVKHRTVDAVVHRVEKDVEVDYFGGGRVGSFGDAGDEEPFR